MLEVWPRREVRPLLLGVQGAMCERRHAAEGVPRADLGLFCRSVAVRQSRPVLLHDGTLAGPRVRPSVVEWLRSARARQRVRLLLEALLWGSLGQGLRVQRIYSLPRWGSAGQGLRVRRIYSLYVYKSIYLYSRMRQRGFSSFI